MVSHLKDAEKQVDLKETEEESLGLIDKLASHSTNGKRGIALNFQKNLC